MTTTAGRRGLTRREGLIALAVLAPSGLIAACSGSESPAVTSADGSTTALPSGGAQLTDASSVADAEQALVDAYENVLAGTTDAGVSALLSDIRDQHAAHRDALGGSSAATAPAPAGGGLAALVALEREAARARIDSCVQAADPELARTLAFIAASEASHVSALRDAGA